MCICVYIDDWVGTLACEWRIYRVEGMQMVLFKK